MSDMGIDHFEWLRGEFRKDPRIAAGQLELAAEDELVFLLDVLDDIAEAYREQHPDVSKKAMQLRARLNDMRWPSLATGYPLRKTPKQQDLPKKPASQSLRHARRRMDQARPAALETTG